jgi:N-acetylglucosaminyl-diphospho-decaprenol L-rhamnosyltransferase
MEWSRAMSDHPADRLPLTVVVLTLNEERHLADCLQSAIELTDQVIVLDSGSTDRTLEIAETFNVCIHRRRFDGYANQRNAAIDMVQTEWTLFLDADEYLPAPLIEEIRQVISNPPDNIAGYRIPRENRFASRPLRGGGWWPDAQLRLFRTANGHYDPAIQVHEHLQLSGSQSQLESPMIHINFDSFSEFRAIQRRYAVMEADQHLRQGDVGRRRTIVGRPFKEFWRRFVSLNGYRDGSLGFLLASSMGWYEFQKWRNVRSRRDEFQPAARKTEGRFARLDSSDEAIDVSVVIVSYNTSDLLNNCLSSIEAWLEANSHTGEIIVVDNASTDGTASMIRRRFPDITLIQNRHNAGFAAANNQGMRAAHGRHICLLNPDTTVLGDAFGQLADYLDDNPGVGIVGPRLMYPDGTVQPSRRRFPTRLTGYLESTIIQDYWPDNRVVRRYYLADQPDNRTQTVDWLVGACLMVRRSAIESAGLLDERYFMYSEEVEWCYRMKQYGWSIVYLPSATVVHHEGASSSQNVPQRQIHFDSSKVLLYRQLYGKVSAWSLHVFLLMTYLVRIIIEMTKGLIGHKRSLRWQRVGMYTRVFTARFRGSGGHS